MSLPSTPQLQLEQVAPRGVAQPHPHSQILCTRLSSACQVLGSVQSSRRTELNPHYTDLWVSRSWRGI